jgi:anti-anti-sigma regulatory factor
MASADNDNLEMFETGDHTVVNFKNIRGLDVMLDTINIIELLEHWEQYDHKKLMLNLRNIKRLSSAELGKLVLMREMLLIVGATLSLCNVSSLIQENLRRTGFNKLIKIEPYPGDDADGVLARIIPPRPSRSGAVSIKLPPSEEDA